MFWVGGSLRTLNLTKRHKKSDSVISAYPMEPRHNGPRQNGPRQNGPRQNGPRQNGPRQNGPRQNGPQPLECDSVP